MAELITAVLHGIFLAFGLIIPLGVQNVFIFNQGATQPTLLKALPSVLTAAICDTIAIAAAVLGVSLLIMELAWLKLLIFSVGFVFLIYMGITTWNKATVKLSSNQKALSAKKQIIFAASVSILNPHAIIDTVAVIGTNSVEYSGHNKIAFTLSCIAVSWIWFYSLAIAGRIMHKLDNKGTRIVMVNKAAAVIILCLAAYIGIQLLADLRVG